MDGLGFETSCALGMVLPAIMSVIYAGISPAQALAAARRQAKRELRSRRKPSTETKDIVRRRFMNN